MLQHFELPVVYLDREAFFGDHNMRLGCRCGWTLGLWVRFTPPDGRMLCLRDRFPPPPRCIYANYEDYYSLALNKTLPVFPYSRQRDGRVVA